MKPEDVTNYHGLSEDVKDQYKPINAEGDFISESAIENTEVAHRIAILEHEAFGELEEGITNGGITVDEIVAKLADKHTVFDEQRKLKEMLFQHADLRRLKGAPIDDQLVDVLKKTYASLEYSKILTEKLTKGIEDGDVAVIGEMLKDEKFHASWAIFKKLSTDKERVAAFAVCKERIKSACLLINEVQDIEVALAMYIEALPLADEKSHSDKGNIESTGKNLAEKFFASGATEKLIELLKSGDFKLSYCKDFMNLLGDRQEVIIDMIKYSSNVKDICYALKFVTKPELLTRLGEGGENLMKLDSEKSDEVNAHAEKIAHALMNKPSIMILSELRSEELV